MSTPVVHLELHTNDATKATKLFRELFDWRAERVETEFGSYLALGLGREPGAGVVEYEVKRPLWLPYVEVEGVEEATRRARQLGAKVVLEPREGPAGWRSVIATQAGAHLALWQPKEPR